MNAAILYWFQSIRQPWLDEAILQFSATINIAAIIPFILLLFKKTRKQAATVCMAIILTFVVTNLLKSWIAEPRPFEVLPDFVRVGKVPAGSSFPSMHTSLAFALSLPLLIQKNKWGWPVLVYSVLIALSRLYLGVHYPTDVLGGFLVSLTISALVCAAERRSHASRI